MKKNQIAAYFIGLGGIWGASFIAIEYVVAHFPPVFAAAVRIIFASLCLAGFCLMRREPLRLPLRIALRIWPLGILMIGLPFAFLFWGEQYIAPGLAGVLNGTVPLWTAFFQIVVSSMRSKPIAREIVIGLVLGFFGIVLLFARDLALPLNDREIMGGLAVLMMAICYAIGNVLSHKVLMTMPSIPLFSTTFHQHLASAVLITLLSLIFEGPRFFETTSALSHDFSSFAGPLAVLFYLGLVPSALAFTLYFQLIKVIGSVKSGAVAYLIPVSALAFDFLFHAHIPALNAWCGAGLILLGLRFIRMAA